MEQSKVIIAGSRTIEDYELIKKSVLSCFKALDIKNPIIVSGRLTWRLLSR